MIDVNSAHLAHSIVSPVLPGTDPDHPEISGVEGGMVIAARKIVAGPETLEFRLLVTFEVPSPILRAFRQPAWAVKVVLECPETGQTAAFDLQDPFAEYGPLGGPNYAGDPPASAEPPDNYEGQRLALDVEVPLPEGKAPVTVYATAHLQGRVSNTLAIDGRTGVATSIGEG